MKVGSSLCSRLPFFVILHAHIARIRNYRNQYETSTSTFEHMRLLYRKGRRCVAGGVLDVYPPPLPVARQSVLEMIAELAKRKGFPLWGSVAFPNPLDRHRLCCRPSPLWRNLLTFIKHVHHSHAVCPLWPMLPTRDCSLRGLKFNKKHVFYRSNSS